ncbi:unnamed protein product [Strongylus vulgaris]|uniref:Band 3 cytoplasmic domain-containing protein n=1 Tax=Strongylus vulgaris TaxID=40348 RepID=A0A3P7LAP6_STRVU|nr:unnamed protein product [Strongylus vulgaris]
MSNLPNLLGIIGDLKKHFMRPVENVRRLVLLHPNDDPLIFSELMTLEDSEDGEVWKQTTRWIRYEQIVEGGFTRFSKPHISLLHMQAMMQARNCFKKGVVLLDEEATDYESIVSNELMTLEDSEDGEIWKQTTRWIRYEQIVEGGFTRFSKPHISLLHMQAMMQARNCFKKGVVLLDEDATDYESIVNVIVNEWVKRGLVRTVATNAIRDILMAPKQHLGAVPGKNYFGI